MNYNNKLVVKIDFEKLVKWKESFFLSYSWNTFHRLSSKWGLHATDQNWENGPCVSPLEYRKRGPPAVVPISIISFLPFYFHYAMISYLCAARQALGALCYWTSAGSEGRRVSNRGDLQQWHTIGQQSIEFQSFYEIIGFLKDRFGLGRFYKNMFISIKNMGRTYFITRTNRLCFKGSLNCK